jgi:hypothetical protein
VERIGYVIFVTAWLTPSYGRIDARSISAKPEPEPEPDVGIEVHDCVEVRGPVGTLLARETLSQGIAISHA